MLQNRAPGRLARGRESWSHRAKWGLATEPASLGPLAELRTRSGPALIDQLIEIAWGQAAAQTGISWEDYRKPLKCLVEALPGQPALGSSN